VRRDVVREGHTHHRTGLQWVHTVREIQDFLAGAGLVAESLSASLQGEPFQVGSPYLLIVALESGLSR
jgi:hypothetical protein